jgi:uncharacterized protein YegL
MRRSAPSKKISRIIPSISQQGSERSRIFLLPILILTLIGGLWGVADTWAQITQGPVAEKRLDPTSVEASEWAKVNIIVKGYSTYSSAVVPFDAVLVIDLSGSMKTSDPENQRLDAAKHFVSLASSGIRIGVVSYADHAQVVSQLTTDYPSLNSAIGSLATTADGLTNMAEAMKEAQKMLIQTGQTANRYIILLSDGWPEPDYEAQVNEIQGPILREAVDNSLTYYTIGFGFADIALLQDIALTTGGTFQSSTPEGLQAVYGQIFQVAAHQLVAGQIVLKEKLDSRLKVRPGSLWVSQGLAIPSSDQLNQFYSTGVLEMKMGQLRSGFERSLSFEVSAPGCLSPDDPQESIDIPVDLLPDAHLEYVFGASPGSVPVEQRILTCKRPGSVRIEKEFDPTASKVTLKITNNYPPHPTQDRRIKNIQVVEGPSLLFQPDFASVTSTDPPSRFIPIPWGEIDILVWEIASLAPLTKWEVSFSVRSRACRPADLNPLRVDARKDLEKFNSEVIYTKPDGVRERRFIPQAYAVLPDIEVCDGRPDLHVTPAFSEQDYFTPEENPFTYVLARDETESVWVDGSYNGFVDQWNNAGQIQARLEGASGSGLEVKVKGQGDHFYQNQHNKIYVRVTNTGNKASPEIPSGLSLELRNHQTNSWDRIANSDIPAIQVLPAVNRVFVVFKLSPGAITPFYLRDYGLSLAQLLDLLRQSNPSLFTSINSYLLSHPAQRSTLQSLGPILPSQLSANLSPALAAAVQNYLSNNPNFLARWVRKVAKLRIQLRSAPGEKHTNNNETTELIIVK